MTIRSKFNLWGVALLALVLTPAAVSTWNMREQDRAMGAASAEYSAMERASAVAVQVGWLRDSLRSAEARTFHDPRYFQPIQEEMQLLVRDLQRAAQVDSGDTAQEMSFATELVRRLDAPMKRAAEAATPTSAAEIAAQLDDVNKALAAVGRLGPDAARRHVLAASVNIHQRLMWLLLGLAAVSLASGVIHYKQYRLLVRPLLWLRDDMRKSASSDYRPPVQARGDPEFKEMAVYFNGLARDLSDLYRNLEEKVIARSRELVRSERLASVGFLAAGVAHEINNPLSVISGYAELAGKSLREVLTSPHAHSQSEAAAEAEAEALASAMDAQKVIREEAFRCKEITSRLLSLARGGSDDRQPLLLGELAQQVATLTRGLRNYRDRRVLVAVPESDGLRVVANATEMKQVLLNLMVNALEAVSPEGGEVRVGGRRSGEWVELYVEDNGKGMSAQTLNQIFEPFFTAKRGAGEPGTGLGLSITHAIVENHGGRIVAHSAGPGRGSRFTVTLPAAAPAQPGARRLVHQ